VNLLAIEEYEERSTRLAFMKGQYADLIAARDSLHEAIGQINSTASQLFMDTFRKVQENFQKTFLVLFQGGECSLSLVGDDPLECEIEIMARPRGKRPQSIAQLSSGERALTAIALLFAIYLVKPSPFCILDEVDAPLDDANVDRFVAMIREFSERTQFIVITHNKKTMEACDTLYGVTMQTPGISQVVSVRLSEADQVLEGRRLASNRTARIEARERLPELVLAGGDEAPSGMEAGNGHGNGHGETNGHAEANGHGTDDVEGEEPSRSTDTLPQ
jgi:chromosome segregation protein